MTTKQTLIVVFFYILKRISSTDSYDFIQNRDFEEYRLKASEEMIKKCMKPELAAYGLEGDAISLNEPNELCPGVKSNCCGKKDIAQIKKYWIDDDRHMQTYQTIVLYVFKYIIGYWNQYSFIAAEVILQYQIMNNIDPLTLKKRKTAAGTQNQQKGDDLEKNAAFPEGDFKSRFKTFFGPKNFKVSNNEYCYKAALKMMKLDYVNVAKAEHFYELLNKRVMFFMNARRGFYCTLCSADSKPFIRTKNFFTQLFGFNTILYDKQFCQLIYSWTFETNYQIYKNVNPFLEYTNKMLACVEPLTASQKQQMEKREGRIITYDWNSKNPIKNEHKDVKSLFDNPLNIKSTIQMELCFGSDPEGVFFMIKCEFYCNLFELAGPDPTIDSDVDALMRVYKHLRSYEFALYSNTMSVFDVDVFKLVNDIDINYKLLGGRKNFYRTLQPNIDFSKYLGLFGIVNEGINPLKDADLSTLTFKFKNDGIMQVLTLFFSFWLLF